MRISDLDRKILDHCNDKTSREIAEAANANYKTVQWRIKELKANEYIVSHRRKSNAVNGYTFYYKRTDKPLEDYKPKEYQPLGMCVLGVWL